VGGLTILHALLASITPLLTDEAYYWDCSRHADWSYFDQPPLVIWAIIPFRFVLGASALAARAPVILASLILALILVPLVRRLGGGLREATWAYLVMHVMPLFFLGSFYVSTDIAMITAYVAASWAAVALAQGEKRAWWGFGVACGLGFLAKFPIVLVLPALLPALLRRDIRQHLRTPTPYLAGLLALALTAPAWIWGALHDWDNITFQLAGRHSAGSGFTLKHLGAFIAGNLLLATPFLCVAIFIALWDSRRRSDPGWAAFRIAAVMPFVAFGLVSLLKHVGMHWGAPGLVLGTVVLALIPIPGRRIWVGLATVIGLAISLLAVFTTIFPEPVVRAVWQEEERRGGSAAAGVSLLIGNEEIAAQISARRLPHEVVVSQAYPTVHHLAFLSGGELPTALANVRGGVHGLASLYWHRPEQLTGVDAFFVSEKADTAGLITPLFAECVGEEPIRVMLDGREIRHVHVLRCYDLRQPVPAFTRLDGGDEQGRGP
jgi:4-amino-4-deoxy-L-arabinose transferase-like glycosyltransferase